MKLKDIMVREVVTVSPEESTASAARRMRSADQSVMSSAFCHVSSVSSVKRPGGGLGGRPLSS